METIGAYINVNNHKQFFSSNITAELVAQLSLMFVAVSFIRNQCTLLFLNIGLKTFPAAEMSFNTHSRSLAMKWFSKSCLTSD